MKSPRIGLFLALAISHSAYAQLVDAPQAQVAAAQAQPGAAQPAVVPATTSVLYFQGEPREHRPAKVSYDDFKTLVAEVESHRAERLVDLDTFLKMASEPGVIILDTRSAERFARIHVSGAINLPFTEFTQENLAKVIPSFATKILIYCNNNFEGNPVDFPSKMYNPRDAARNELARQPRPIMLALNVPTYINLYGYGYKNVYELNELVDVSDRRIQFEPGSPTRSSDGTLRAMTMEEVMTAQAAAEGLTPAAANSPAN